MQTLGGVKTELRSVVLTPRQRISADGSGPEDTSPPSSLLHPKHIYYGKYARICVLLDVFRDRKRVTVCMFDSINTERQKNVDLSKSRKAKLV